MGIIIKILTLPFRILGAIFKGKNKVPEEKDLVSEIKTKKKEIKVAEKQLGRGKSFNEMGMRKKLRDLEASIRRTPGKLKYLEHLFKRYQAKIKQNYKVLRDKDGMNASLQSIIRLVKWTKDRGAYKAKKEQESMIKK